MYHTGCDIHDEISQLQHIDEDGALGLFMEVPTTKEGFSLFLDQLDAPTTMTLEASVILREPFGKLRTGSATEESLFLQPRDASHA